MIIKCPECGSENVTRLSADFDEFICDDCGHDFEDNDEEVNDEVVPKDDDEFDHGEEYEDSLIEDDDEDEQEED